MLCIWDNILKDKKSRLLFDKNRNMMYMRKIWYF